MAENFPILFTGKEASYEPRTTGELERSRERFNQRFLAGKQIEREDRQRSEDFYYKTADIDPVQVMSDRLTREQEQVLTDFNNKWAGEIAKDGTLTQAQKSSMFRDRKLLEAKQAKWTASQQMYERDHAVMKRDRVKGNRLLDDSSFQEAEQNYFQTGEYESGVQYTSIKPDAYFSKQGKTWSGSKDIRDVTQTIGDELHTRKVSIPGTTEEARADVEAHIRGDNSGRLLQGVVEEFQGESDDVKAQYLIVGDVDTPEEENAIMRYAKDKYSPLLRRVDKTTKEKEKAAGDRFSGGKATSSTGKVYFQAAENVKGQIVGDGKGLQFNDAKPVDVSVDMLELPEGMEIVQGSVRAYPVVAANGKIEFRLDTRGVTVLKKTKKITSIPSSKMAAASAAGKDENGFYTYEDKLPEGTRGAALISDVYSDIDTQFGNNVFKKAIDKYFPGWETGTTGPGNKWVRVGEPKK